MTLTFVRMRNYSIIEKNEFSPLFLHLAIGIFASLVSRGVWSEAFINFFGIIVLVYLKKFMVDNNAFLASITNYCIVLNNSNLKIGCEDYNFALKGINIS